MSAVVTAMAFAPATKQEHIKYALLRGSYDRARWWTGSAWEAVTDPDRIAYFDTRSEAETALATVAA